MSLEQKADKDYRYVLGKIDKLKLMEPLYRKTLTENEILKAKLGALEEKPSSDKMSANVSITQHLLNSANIKDLEHPTDFFEVLDKEKKEEIKLLKEKARDSKRNVDEVQQQKDRLKLQADDLTTQLTEKDRRLKELEETLFPATDEKDLSSSSSSRREREGALRGLRGLTPDDLSHPTTMQRRTVDDEELEETASLRRKIDELQQRVEELQNHNDKWEARCKELQQELSKVKCQLQQYQNAEISDRAKMMASLRDQQLRTEQAERMALAAKRQIDELERKVVDLETQLAEKERRRREQEQQDRINAKVEEVVREKTMLYVEQVKAYREDFEGEKRAHENTKTQLTSLTQQWRSVYDRLKDVNQQLSDANQRLETLKRENEKLEFQLEQARKDQLLIRNRLSEFGLMTLYDRFKASESTATNDHSSIGPSTLSKWTCRKCTFINSGKSVNCEMCNESNKIEQFPQPLTEIPSYSSEKLSLTKIHLEEDGSYVNQSTFTKSNKDSSNKHALSQEDAHSQLTDDRNFISMNKKSS